MDTLAMAGGRTLGGIISKFKTLKNIGYNTFKKMFETGVDSVLNYGGEVWGSRKSYSINRIQNRAIRYFLGLPPKTLLSALQGEMGWLTQSSKKWTSMCRFWNRLIKMNTLRITRKIFEWDWSRESDSWCQDMKYIFDKLNLSEVWLNKTECDINVVQERLLEIDAKEWAEERDSKPKLRTYRIFKNSYVVEKYILQCTPKHERSLMAQLRCGVLPLEIEIGRYRKDKDGKKLDVNERKCKVCNTDVVEDESHFILHCTKFDAERSCFFKSINIDSLNLSPKELLTLLMTEHQKGLCKFIIEIWYKRKGLLYL